MQQESIINNNKHAQEPINKNVTVRADKKITKRKQNCNKSRSTWNIRIFTDLMNININTNMNGKINLKIYC